MPAFLVPGTGLVPGTSLMPRPGRYRLVRLGWTDVVADTARWLLSGHDLPAVLRPAQKLAEGTKGTSWRCCKYGT